MADYNGWKNYETWNVNLWIDNEQGSQEWLRENAIECLQNAIDEDSNEPKLDASIALADRIEEMIEEFVPEVTGLYADLLNAALREVDYREIAEAALRDIDIFSACWNMPGCLPENEPALFLDHSDAIEYLVDSIESGLTDDEDQNEEAENAIEELKDTDDGEEVSVDFDGYVYSVSVL
jgi:hypothetical protein